MPQYQAQAFCPKRQQWADIGSTTHYFADAIRQCWLEQQVWINFQNGTAPDCRIGVLDYDRLGAFESVPYDPDFMCLPERNDEIVMHAWRCSVHCANYSGKTSQMFDAMMERH